MVGPHKCEFRISHSVSISIGRSRDEGEESLSPRAHSLGGGCFPNSIVKSNSCSKPKLNLGVRASCLEMGNRAFHKDAQLCRLSRFVPGRQ